MKLFLGILAVCMLLASNAQAQSSRISNWTEKSYSEEQGIEAYSKSFSYHKSKIRGYKPFRNAEILWRGFDDLDFLSGIRCIGRYCDNKQFRYTSGFQVDKKLRRDGVDLKMIYAKTGDGEVKCPKDYYIAQMWCTGGSYCGNVAAACVKPVVADGAKAVCGMQKKISEEAGDSGKANEVALMTFQLFDGMKCTGDNCDDLTMSWCNIDGTGKGVIPLELEGATWKEVGSMIAGTRETSYTAGLEMSSGSTHEAGGSLTISVETTAKAGVIFAEASATAGVAVTGHYAKQWNSSKASSSEVTVSVACDRLGEDAIGADVHAKVYAFSLLAKDRSHSVDADFQAVSGAHYACSYGSASAPAPVCFPDDCNNAFATNCQKCGGASISEAWDEEPIKVDANYRKEPETLGSYVEFYGWWNWKDTEHQPAEKSYLVLHNDNERRNKYTLCNENGCELLDGDYLKKVRGAELVLKGVFGETNSRIVFTAQGGGKVTGSYWRDASKRGSEPDGTIELNQL